MPMPWSVPEHTDAPARLHTALADPGRAGAVVLGPDGVGKSTLARRAAERYAAEHPGAVVRRVTGTPTEQAVPFGACSRLVDVADIGKPAALLRSARQSLRSAADDLLIVDDANQLDGLSATLVYQLALAGATRMIVTARADTAPPPIRALWVDDLLLRIDIGSDRAATDSRKIDAFVAELPEPVRAVLDLLSVQEPVPLPDLVALTSATALDDAARLGVVEIVDGEVFTAHPLFAACAATALGDAGARRLRSRLLAPAMARARPHPADRLRVAALAVCSDTPQPADVATAAGFEALRLGDVALAERLGRGALADSDTLAGRLLVGQALAWQGRGREADEMFAAVDPTGLSEDQLMTWALPRAANQFWMLGAPEQATAFLHAIRGRLTEQAARTTVDALTATFAMNAGNVVRARQIATEVLASPVADDTAVAWAASAAALSAARSGAFAEVAPMAEFASGAEHPGLLRFTVGLAQTTTLLMAGDTDGAAAVAQQYTDFAELQQPGRAIGEVLLASVRLANGEFDSAAALLGPASAILERTGYSWGPLSLMLLTTALAQRGDLAAAARTLSRAESRHGTKSALFAPELGLARAWRLSAGRDTHGAVAAARQAAGMAERSGQFAVAVLCWRDAARLGDTRTAVPLERVAAQSDCALARDALAAVRPR